MDHIFCMIDKQKQPPHSVTLPMWASKKLATQDKLDNYSNHNKQRKPTQTCKASQQHHYKHKHTTYDTSRYSPSFLHICMEESPFLPLSLGKHHSAISFKTWMDEFCLSTSCCALDIYLPMRGENLPLYKLYQNSFRCYYLDKVKSFLC